MSKKLLFNENVSVAEVPLAKDSKFRTLIFVFASNNSYYLNNISSAANLKLQYLTGENAGYISYTQNINVNITVKFLHKDGTIIYEANSGFIGGSNDKTFTFDDDVIITEVSNLKNIRLLNK
jgi:hypothetical protein